MCQSDRERPYIKNRTLPQLEAAAIEHGRTRAPWTRSRVLLLGAAMEDCEQIISDAVDRIMRGEAPSQHDRIHHP